MQDFPLFEILAKSDFVKKSDYFFTVGFGGDLLVANAVKDGFFVDMNVRSATFNISDSSGVIKEFPATFTYSVTNEGIDFIRRYSKGIEIQ